MTGETETPRAPGQNQHPLGHGNDPGMRGQAETSPARPGNHEDERLQPGQHDTAQGGDTGAAPSEAADPASGDTGADNDA